MIQYEQKIWGHVSHLPGGRTGLSLLELTREACCSKHYHKHRWNRFVVLDAQIVVRLYDAEGITYEAKFLGSQGLFDVPPGVIHRFDVIKFGRVVEVYWNGDDSEVDMNDIVRLEEGKLL